jgi:hypothetical protein
MPQGHLSGSLEKACNHHTYLNKRGSVYDKQEKESKSEIKNLVLGRKRESSMA